MVDFASGRSGGSVEGSRGGESFVFCDFGFFVGGKFFDSEFFGELWSEEEGKRAGDVGGEGIAGDFFIFQRGMESFGVGLACGEGFDDGALASGSKVG